MIIPAISELEVKLDCALLSRSTAWLNTLVTDKVAIVIKSDEGPPKQALLHYTKTYLVWIYCYVNST